MADLQVTGALCSTSTVASGSSCCMCTWQKNQGNRVNTPFLEWKTIGISWGNHFGNGKLHENYQTSDGSDGGVIYKMDHHGSNWRNSKRKITRLYAGSMRALTKWLGLKNSHSVLWITDWVYGSMTLNIEAEQHVCSFWDFPHLPTTVLPAKVSELSTFTSSSKKASSFDMAPTQNCAQHGAVPQGFGSRLLDGRLGLQPQMDHDNHGNQCQRHRKCSLEIL